jgi:hypothetical protein
MKHLTAVVLLCAAAMLASAQTINKTVGAGPSNQTSLEVPGMAGKAIVIDVICWSAQSTPLGASPASTVSLAAYDGLAGQPGARGLALIMTPHAAAGGGGVAVVPFTCTPPNMKFTGTAGQDFYAYFNTGILNVAQSITVSGHYE